jgi:hypothetical protein
MSNNVTEKEVSLEEIMKNADLSAGLNLNMQIGEDKEMDVEFKETPEKEKDFNRDKGCWECHVPTMKINCDLEVGVETKNKIIYVCPGKVQYFTATALKCSGDETIEIEYCGDKKHCVKDAEAVIRGCLGYYRIVKSGIIFIPNRKLSEFPDDWFPTDILYFKAKDKCDKDVKFDVVFTYSRCVDCECGCNKSCRC